MSNSLQPQGQQRAKLSLSFTISQRLIKCTSIELVVLSNHLILCLPLLLLLLLVAQMVTNLPAMQETQVWSLQKEDLWRREWLLTPVFLPGEFHGQRTLAGYSPWGHKESNLTEQLKIYIYIFFFSRLFSGKQYYERLSIVPCTIQEVLVAYLLYTVSWLLALKRYHLDTNPSSFTMWSRTYYLTSLCSISSFRK